MIQQELAQLKSYPCPEGVDVALWEELRKALKEALNKTASIPPTGDTNRVNDLGIADNGDGTFTLTWHYRNLGDYDQNGKVGIEDITPLAQHYGETWSEGEEDSLAAVIDGSGNSKVDIADVTPIAQNFGVDLHHYTVQGAHLFNGPFVDLAEVALPESTPTARVELAHGLGEPPYLNWRVVPYDSDGNAGPASNVAVVSEAPPPAVRILSINPLGGVTGAEVTFTANAVGDPPLSYAWDFGGGAAPNESGEASPTVTLGAVDTYQASLTVENDAGSATKNFTLTVSELPGEPPEILSISPTEGNSGTEATFTAEVTGDGPFEYYWSFGGGASPNQASGVSGQPSATVTLSRGGTLPEPVRAYPATLTITNSYGSDVFEFNLNISAWWHELDIPFEHVHTLGLSAEGEPALLRGTQVDVRYEVWNGQSWAEGVLAPATYGILTYDPGNGEPRAMGTSGGGTSGHVVYSWRSNGEWFFESVSEEQGWVGPPSARLAFRLDGSPVACWNLVGDPSILRVAQRTAESWSVETLPTAGLNPGWGSIFVDSSGKIDVMFENMDNPPAIWLAREETSGWELEQVLAGYHGMAAAKASDGKLAFIAEADDNSEVVYAVQSGGGWDICEVSTVELPWELWAKELFFANGNEPLVFFKEVDRYTDEAHRYVAWRMNEAWATPVLIPDWISEQWSTQIVGIAPDNRVIGFATTLDSSTRVFTLYW